MILSYNNKAAQSGRVGYFNLNSVVIFEGLTNATFNNNKALYGGALLISYHSNITVTGNSILSFVGNEAAQCGGAIHLYSHCNCLKCLAKI